MKKCGLFHVISITNSFLPELKHFRLLWAIMGYFGGHMDAFRNEARFFSQYKQCSYQVWRVSVEKSGFYHVNGRRGRLDKKLHSMTFNLESKSQKSHQNIFLALNLDCAKYQFCITNSFLWGAKTTFCGGGGEDGLKTLSHPSTKVI